MRIDDNWEIIDDAIGLRIKVIKGEGLDRLHIEHLLITQGHHSHVSNRDFFFTKEGEFDGTGSSICEETDQIGQYAGNKDVMYGSWPILPRWH